ncbi:MAG: hypothetical protein SFV81_28625 [Pirellulaceae bacterium]|nr:hypothetical protein [Pirellulaceae bacterium]
MDRMVNTKSMQKIRKPLRLNCNQQGSMRFIVNTVAGILCVLLVGSFALSFLPASRIYSVETTFTSAPESDEELRKWLADQPGVVDHTIHLSRLDNQRFGLTFIISQNSWKRPAFPDIESQCFELGYDLSGPFTDAR